MKIADILSSGSLVLISVSLVVQKGLSEFEALRKLCLKCSKFSADLYSTILREDLLHVNEPANKRTQQKPWPPCVHNLRSKKGHVTKNWNEMLNEGPPSKLFTSCIVLND